jgi:hypothetical protein
LYFFALNFNLYVYSMKYKIHSKPRFALFIAAILLVPTLLGYFTYRYFTAPVAIALQNVSAEQKTELIGSVFSRDLEIFKFADAQNEKKQTGEISLTTFDEKQSGSKETQFIFPEKYQDGYKFTQDGIEITMKPKNIDSNQFERKVSQIAKFSDEANKNTGQFLSYEKKVETRFIASDSQEKHLFALSRDNNTLKQWSLYEKYQEEIVEEWEFNNAYIRKTEDGSIEVYKAPIKKESQDTMKNLEPSMAERISATLKEEMGDDYYFQKQNLLFTIPKPYLINKKGENKDADTEIENQNILKIKVKAGKDEFPILLDPTIILAAKMDYIQINGDSAGDYLGNSVSNAGDVNGDGKDDVIVGAEYNNSNTGAVYIFYGGTKTTGSATTRADVKLTGDSAGDIFGASVASAGDVNGDGKDDVIVGATGDNHGGASSGSAFIFYGGVISGTASTVANVKITGDGAVNLFGISVSGAGDVNGDGKDDVIVGTTNNTNFAYIFYGGVTSGSATAKADVKLASDEGNDFGYSVSGIGDMNGDGKDDVIVGAPRHNSWAGAAYIFYGGVVSGTASTVANVKITGDSADDGFGWSVSDAGDINDDGKDDVIVGAPLDDDGGSSSGSAFIFYGGVTSGTASTVANVKITGDSADDGFGWSVSDAGDINDDGKDDVIVGAPLDDDGGSGSGSAFIFYGGIASGAATAKANIKLIGDSANDGFGRSVSDAGDVNSDGKDDVIVGVIYDDDGGNNSGSAKIYTFNDFQNSAKLTGDGEKDAFGYSVSEAGDVNGDGKTDVIVGSAPTFAGGGSFGSAFIFYGGITSGTATNKADVKITGDIASDSFGYSVSGAGDVNGDGKDDVIVGAYNDDDGGNNSGSAFIFYGGVTSGTASVVANVKLTGNGLNGFGFSVSGAGDVNGDGKDDVIVGAADLNDGSVYIFYGGVTSGSATAKADVKLTRDNSSDKFGDSISDAGDVNGDGKDDVIVGAPGYPSGANTGAAYIFYGGVTSGTATNKANIKITGDSASDWFGKSVSGAGDINDDGKDDVIVGAYQDDDNSLSNSGSAFIFYGGVISGTASTVANVKLTGDSATDYFGSSVSGAGDVNGDGKDDVIVGAPQDFTGRNGIAYIFYGGVTSGAATAKANVKLIGDSAYDSFGGSVSGAGDVNGDGKDDVIVGAWGDDDGGLWSGSAFIFTQGPSGEMQKYNGEGANDNFGYSVSSAGDMDRDGKDDVIVGAPGNNSSAGAAYIFYGNKISGTAAMSYDIKITGDSSSDRFGDSISGAGDVNGDGKDDIIVGAEFAPFSGGSGPGIAYIFYGGVTSGSATAKADVKITGDSSEDSFGANVFGAGDVNGDGKDDVIVGAVYDDDGGDGSGSAFIFYGGVTSGGATAKADVKLTGDGANDIFGAAVSGSGDVNGDGKDDLIVGAWADDDGGNDSGSTFIFYGGVTSGSATAKADVKITGDSAGDHFGTNVSNAGDVNGDGKDDVIVGAPNNASNGSAYIFYGGVTSGGATAKASVKITGDSAGDNFGASVSGAGDVNGDGKSDILVGAPYDDDAASDAGSIFIFYGGMVSGTSPIVSGTASALTDVKILGDSLNDFFGYSASMAGDVNGDGKADIIVGAPYDDDGGDGSGSVKIITDLATKDNPDSPNFQLNGDSASDTFGISVSGAGDVNGDGKDDVIVGATGDDDGGNSSGSAFIFYGGIINGSATIKADVKLTGEADWNLFGNSVSGAGDVNGDGKDDVIVSATGYSGNSGAVYIFYGGVTSGAAASRYNVRLTGDSGSDYFGTSVSGVGDVNGDGKDDVIVGAPYDNETASDTGAAFIFYGGVTSGAATTKANVKLTGDNASSRFGFSVSGAGDVNGDGKDDVIAGALSGMAYVFYGGVTSGVASAKANVKIIGDSAGDNFGYSVSGAGDINGDGKDDVVVGARNDNFGGHNSGSTFIFYGGVVSGTASLVANVKITGDSAEANFGTSVSDAGDVNGDGKDDVIVGSGGDDTGGNDSGSAFIFYGGVVSGTASSIANVKITGGDAGDYFGDRISGAGDVNGDGKDDVIAGAWADSSYNGVAYIFYGHRISPEMPTNFTPVSGTYKYGESISASCSGGTYNTNQDKYGQTIVWDMESFYSGQWHEVVSDDADGSYSYSVNSIPNGSGLKLRCRNEIDGLLGGFSSWYEPFGINLGVIQGSEKIEGRVKMDGRVKME